MKPRLAFFLAIVLLFVSFPSARATDGSPPAMITDAVIARPLCLAATAVGSVFFVISLPFTALSKSVNQAAEVLVLKPGRATFTRPLGEFSSWSD
ncbi:MAG: hypothetical protein HY301_01715 [Verrucomicrobia bacterium]|nr:hypothetical protein [Verrucomicrobiota bacterium]